MIVIINISEYDFYCEVDQKDVIDSVSRILYDEYDAKLAIPYTPGITVLSSVVTQFRHDLKIIGEILLSYRCHKALDPSVTVKIHNDDLFIYLT